MLRPRSLILSLIMLSAAALSGQNLRLNLELDRQYYQELVQNNAYLQATLAVEGYAGEQPERYHTVFLVDRSGSMEGGKLENTKRSLHHALALLPASDTVSIISFGSEIETLIPPTPVDQLSGRAAAIENLASEGGSALHEALYKAFELLNRQSPLAHRKRIILLTDGPPNKGPRSPAAFADIFVDTNHSPIEFTTLYLSENASERERKALKDILPSPPLEIEDASNLKGHIADALLVKAPTGALDAELQITFASGIEIVESIGRESEIEGRTIRFRFKNLLPRQERTALTQVTISANKSVFSRLEIASATLSYAPSGHLDASPVVIAQSVNAFFTSSRSVSFESIQTHIYQSISEGEVADTLRETNAWIHEGRSRKALRELKKLSRNLLDIANEIEDLEIDESINQLNKAIQGIESTKDSSIEKAATFKTLYPSASPQPEE